MSSNKRDQFYKKTLLSFEQRLIRHDSSSLFTGNGIILDDKMVGPDAFVSLGVFLIDVQTFSKLFMAPNGSRVFIGKQTKQSLDLAPPGLYVRSTSDLNEYPHVNSVGLYALANQRRKGRSPENQGIYLQGLFIDHIFMDKSKTPPSYGLIAFLHSALAAYAADLSEITLLAGGGGGSFSKQWGIPNMVGYFVWPKFGFDAPLEASEKQGLPQSLQGCSSVCDIMAIDQAWWIANGNGRPMRFDLSPKSKSWQILLNYANGILP